VSQGLTVRTERKEGDRKVRVPAPLVPNTSDNCFVPGKRSTGEGKEPESQKSRDVLASPGESTSRGHKRGWVGDRSKGGKDRRKKLRETSVWKKGKSNCGVGGWTCFGGGKGKKAHSIEKRRGEGLKGWL